MHSVRSLVAGLVLCAVTTASGSIIFAPDFESDFTGGGVNQFTDHYQANTNYSTLSVVAGRFQFESNHQDLGNEPALQGDNHSVVQLSRNKNSDPLPFIGNFGTIAFDWRWRNNTWEAADNSILNVQIGENFRTGAFNPSGGAGNGPSFASLSLQARATEGQFRFIAGGGPGSTAFDLSKTDDFYEATFFMAFNNSGTEQTFLGPDSEIYELNDQSLAVWVGTNLVWNNYTHASNIRTNAGFENIAFGMGNGNNRTFEEAEPFGGTIQLANIQVGTLQGPVAAIMTPAEGATFTDGDSITFSGTGTDSDEVDITASAVWTSSLDGEIGTGGTFTTSSLSVGAHIITMTVTDSEDLTGSASISITVNPLGFFESDFTGTAPSQNLPWTQTSYLADGLSTTGWTYGPGMNAENDFGQAIIDDALGFIVAAAGTRTVLEDAIEDGVYLGITLSGTDMDLNDATVTIAGTLRDFHSNPNHWAVMTSVDGFAVGNDIHLVELSRDPVLAGVSQEFSFTFPDSGYDNLDDIEIRIYPYDGQWGSNPAPSLDTFRITGATMDGDSPMPEGPVAGNAALSMIDETLTLTLEWSGLDTTKTYAFEATADLTDPDGWEAIDTIGPGVEMDSTTDNSAASHPNRFYRLKQQP